MLAAAWRRWGRFLSGDGGSFGEGGGMWLPQRLGFDLGSGFRFRHGGWLGRRCRSAARFPARAVVAPQQGLHQAPRGSGQRGVASPRPEKWLHLTQKVSTSSFA